MGSTNIRGCRAATRDLVRVGWKFVVGAAVMLAAWLPLGAGDVAGATGSITNNYVCTQSACNGNGTQSFGANLASFGAGASGEIHIVGTGFADDGGSVTVSSNAPGVTFSGAAETSSNDATVYFESSTSTAPGSYSLTIKDDANPSGVTNNGENDGQRRPDNLGREPQHRCRERRHALHRGRHWQRLRRHALSRLHQFSQPDKTDERVHDVGQLDASDVRFEALNAANSQPATAGAYAITVTNPDGGTATQSNALTVSSAPIGGSQYPSAFASASQSETVTVGGQDFNKGPR